MEGGAGIDMIRSGLEGRQRRGNNDERRQAKIGKQQKSFENDYYLPMFAMWQTKPNLSFWSPRNALTKLFGPSNRLLIVGSVLRASDALKTSL